MSVRPPFTIIAIDGGAASGKSSTSRILADRFNLLHVDTGSFYRHITYELLRQNVSHSDHPAIVKAVTSLEFDTRLNGRSAQMLIGGQPAGDEIRGQSVNEHVSHYAAVPEVRAALLAYQRGQVDVAQRHGFRGLVMEGRDIGSVIFPNADFRFFLHADPVERAKRRAAEEARRAAEEAERLKLEQAETARRAAEEAPREPAQPEAKRALPGPRQGLEMGDYPPLAKPKPNSSEEV